MLELENALNAPRLHQLRAVESFRHVAAGVTEHELRARRDGTELPDRELTFPTGRDGLMRVQFVEAVAASHTNDAGWITPKTVLLETGH